MDMTLARPPIGQLLDGRYRVESYLARGGMATVYLGTDTRLERTVALKVMHAEFADDEDFVRRFVTEAKSVARLSHPNVVAVFDQGADGRTLYLAMEYVPGRTLRELLAERGRLGPAEALTIMDGVLAGLAAAHEAGMAHRDVKPENVLLGTRAVKVADFGLATLVAGESHTRSGMIIGTAAYLAPEQVAGRRADARTDVYAAGVMLFELLTGTQPHKADSPLAVAYKHVNDVVPPPSSVVPGLPPALDTLVTLATSRDPDLRPNDAGQFLRAVNEARRQLSFAGTRSRGRHSGGSAPSDDETIPPGTAAGAPWPGSPGSPAPGYDIVPGLRAPATRTDTGATQVAGPMAPAANHTLVVSAGADPYGTGAPPYAGPREPRLQQLLFSRRLGYLSAAVAVAALAGLLVWWLTAGRYTTVPKVNGLAVTAATADLRQAGLSVAGSRTETSDSVAKGQVAGTSPGAGASVARGGHVTLLISAGPKMVSVPQVTGQSLSAAEAALRRAGLTPGTVARQAAQSLPAGLVIATQPSAGTSWPQSKPVGIDVSAGPPVPNFVGQPLSTAQTWASQNDVRLVPLTGASDQPSGNVFKQSVPPGSPFTRGQVIQVTVSSGPPMVSVPNVDGMKLGNALFLLHKHGFVVQVNKFGPFDTVVHYSPSGQAPQGSTITVFTGPSGFGGGGNSGNGH